MIRSGLWLALVGALGVVGAERPGRVYVYAQRETPATGWMEVRCDGRAAAGIRRGYFFAMELDAGRHVLEVEGGVPVGVELSAGRDVFVRLDWNHQVGRAPIAVLRVTGKERAEGEMRFLSYVEGQRIRWGAVLRLDPRVEVEPQLKRRGPG